MDRHTKTLLAQIVDRCDNTLCHLPSTHPKHRRYFELFKHLANIVSSIAGEDEVLWWKEYTSNRANYDKVYYNTRKIGEILSQLPENIREQILDNIRDFPGSDFILEKYEKEELMKKIVEGLSEREGKLMEEEIFWEYIAERRIGGELRIYLYPRKEWGLKLGIMKVVLEGDHYKMVILANEIRERLKVSKSFKDVDISSDRITLMFNETPNIDEEIKKSILELNKMIIKEKEMGEKIGKALEGLAVPKENEKVKK